MNDTSPPSEGHLSSTAAVPAAVTTPALDVEPPAREPQGERVPLLVIRSWAPLQLENFREIWQARDLLFTLAQRDVSVRYKQTVLGVLWAVLQPALQTAVFTVLFHQMAGIQPPGDVPFVPFVLAGIAIWGLFSMGLTQAADSVVRNSNLISKVYFPRLVIPLSSLFVALVDFAIATAMLLAVMAYYHIWPGLSALLIVPLTLQTMLAAAGAGFFLAALNVEYRDVRYALPFAVQIMMYATPVFYPADRLPARLRPLLELNPVAALIEGFRAALFGQPMPYGPLGVSLLLTLLMLAAGWLYFRRFERTMSDRI